MLTTTHIFTGNKPSKAAILKKCIELAGANYPSFGIEWGESQLDFHSASNNKLHGYGWIKEISGSDIADIINTK